MSSKIKVIISGPQASGKTVVREIIQRALLQAGRTEVQVIETNVDVKALDRAN